MAPKFLPLLFIFYLSSSLLSLGTTVCVPRSSPYNSLLHDYLPLPKSIESSDTSGSHTFDSNAASLSPSTSPSTKSSSPQYVKPPLSSSAPKSFSFSDTSGSHNFDPHAASPSPSSSSSTPKSFRFSDTSGSHTADSHAASPSPSTSPSMKSLSPQSVKPPTASSTPKSVRFSDTSGSHTSDSDAASPSPSTSPPTKSSSPQSVQPPPSFLSSTPKFATTPPTTSSSSMSSRSPFSSPAPPVSSSTSPPTPKSTPTPSKTSSPVPPVSSTTSPPTPKSTPSPSKTPAPMASSSSPSNAPSPSGMVEAVVSATADAASSAAKATSNAASSVAKATTKAIKSKMTNSNKLINVLDSSLKAICDKLPFPDLCMDELPFATEDDIKAIDLNGALGLAIADLLNEARATRDKARNLVTNDFVYDPINLCNRTMGGALSDSKDALASYELKDWGSVKSNFDSYVHRLGVCMEKTPQGLMAEMEKIDKLWQNANAILCTIDPTLKPAS